jgi:hypothetical protein
MLSAIVQPTCDQATGQLTILNYNNAYTYYITPSIGVTIDALGNISAPAGIYSLVASNATCESLTSIFTIDAQPVAPMLDDCFYSKFTM